MGILMWNAYCTDVKVSNNNITSDKKEKLSDPIMGKMLGLNIL